jgi:hypothetical protein
MISSLVSRYPIDGTKPPSFIVLFTQSSINGSPENRDFDFEEYVRQIAPMIVNNIPIILRNIITVFIRSSLRDASSRLSALAHLSSLFIGLAVSQFTGLEEGPAALLGVAGKHEGNPQVAIGIGIIRLQAEDFIKVFDGTLMLAKAVIRKPPIVVGNDII